MKKVTLMLFTLIMVSVVFSRINAQTLLTERFDNPTDTLLGKVGWTLHSGTDDAKVRIKQNLTYSFYPFSTADTTSGLVILQGKGVGSGDYNRSFTKVTSGSLYTSMLVRVDSAGLAGDYFFHYKENLPNNNIYPARIFIRDDSTKTGHFTFGLQKGSSGAVYTSKKFEYKKTYLLVAKYEFVGGDTTGTDDKIYLYINPSSPEPTVADLTNSGTDLGGDQPINAIALRQGGTYYKVAVDGIRVSPVWDSLKISKPIAVTFQADMSVQIAKDAFKVGTDTLVVRGSFQKDAGFANDWSGMDVVATDANNDKIYTVTVNLPADSAGKAYKYKFVKNSGGWESSSDRSFTLSTTNPQVLAPIFFNNEKPAAKTYHITFIADLSGILGASLGYFNPETDSIIVDGLNWEGGSNVTGNRRMEPSLQGNGLYETTVAVTATGDSTKWKFHAFPESHFSNSGYESGDDNWFVYGTDTVVTIGPRVPRITPSAPALTEDVKVLFQVDMNGAKNSYDASPIPKADIFFVGVKGSADVLGKWGGVWTVVDTTTTPQTIIPLYDNGFFGDKVAGDNVWSRMITFAKGTPGGAIEYKFAAWYKDADKHTSSANVLDNEAGFGKNHSFALVNSTTVINLKNNFGEMTTDVKQVNTKQIPTVYALAQNFPNPFNPATTIRYSVPQAGLVTLKIFNMLGQEVANLVHAQQSAGNYEVSFDASRLSSGIYLYNLTSGSFSSTKKMMLVK